MVGVVESVYQAVHAVGGEVEGQDEVDDQQGAPGAGDDVIDGIFHRFKSSSGKKVFDDGHQRILEIGDGKEGNDGKEKDQERKDGEEKKRLLHLAGLVV